MVVSAIAGHVAVSRRLLMETRSQRAQLDQQTV
jgi:hypothetical protein